VVSIETGKGKDGAMTSEPSMPAEQWPVPPQEMTPDVPAATPTTSATPHGTPESAVKFTRAAALWTALIVGFLILILLLVFILQNTDSTTIHFFVWQWNLPVGVAILLAAVGGGLLTVLAGTVRMLQLRRAAKKNLKAGL
jgi:uncharacterized integral membrane protein